MTLSVRLLQVDKIIQASQKFRTILIIWTDDKLYSCVVWIYTLQNCIKFFMIVDKTVP